MTIGAMPMGTVLADIPKNGLSQKIGSYTIQLNTVPTIPTIGKKTNILISIASSNSDLPSTDIPIVIRILKDDSEINKTKPIFLSGGHMIYPYVFKVPGLYGLHVDFLNNSLGADSGSNQLSTFEFPLQISDTNQISLIATPVVVLALGIGIAFLAIKKHRVFLHMLKKRNL